MISIIKKPLKKIYCYLYWQIFNVKNKARIYNYFNPRGSYVGKHVMIRKNTFIYGPINIGDYSYISGPNTLVHGAKIGKFCSIARNCVIGPGNHNLNSISTHPFLYSFLYGFVNEYSKPEKNEAPIIGNDVWIGINSIVLNNVKIGNGAIIAAGSVVTKDVDPYAIVGGVPAKLIRYRFSEDQIHKLQTIKWWDWEAERIKKNIRLFKNPGEFLGSMG